MATAAAPPDADGFCSLSLHAGANVGVAARRRRRPRPPARRRGERPLPGHATGWGDHHHRLHVDEIDVLIESESTPYEIVDPEPTDVERAIAAHIQALIPDGATLQTGIGAVPSVVAALLAEGDGGDYGIHSEMFTTGLMKLHQAGKVTNARKGQFDGVSICTFAGGTRELYDWLDDNREVAFLPVEVVNSPERHRRRTRR